MKKLVNRILQFISFRVIGRNTTRKVLIQLFHSLDFNLLEVAHKEMGVNNYGSNIETGEEFFLKSFLSTKFKNQPITIVDAGANTGEYSLLLKDVLPLATIYAFEPNPVTFKVLKEKTKMINNVKSFSIGLGSAESTMEIYTYKNDKSSEHASVIKEVMVTLHKSEQIENYQVSIINLDSFCKDHSLEKIHFLKIDTEGFELEVLKGAAHFIKEKNIEVIQFEFNEMNIFSRVFLHDFYTILPNYKFYRLDTKKLIPLGDYNSSNEIFRYQNIIAVLD